MRHLHLMSLIASAQLVACASGVSQQDGLKAFMRVSGGTFNPGPVPPQVDGGATLFSPTTKVNTIQVGQINFQLGGELSPNATGVALSLAGDVGYWTLPAGPNEDLASPTSLSFSATLSFSPDGVPLDAGVDAGVLPDAGTALILNMYALDAQGNPGPVYPLYLQLTSGFPAGAALVISLSWANETDLDLHVINPDGGELWSEKRTFFQPPPFGQKPKPGATYQALGYLDFDSNNQCLIDGRREENAVWFAGSPDGGTYPPPGHYRVRIDTWSLCGQPDCYWDLKTYLYGSLVAENRGVSLPADTRPPHGAGAGLEVLTFTIGPDGGYVGP